MFATAPVKYYIFDSNNVHLWRGYSYDRQYVEKTASEISKDKKVEVVILTSKELDAQKLEIVKTSRVRDTPINKY